MAQINYYEIINTDLLLFLVVRSGLATISYSISMGVLNFLNIVPTQFHLNGWTSIQAFSFLRKLLSLSSNPKSFLYYYSSRPGKQPGWLSLISKPRICFLKPFTSSIRTLKGFFFQDFNRRRRKEIFL